VSTDTIEHLIGIAREQGAQAAKVCGAGGGGCVIFVVESDRKAAVSTALNEAGGEVLDVELTACGLRIEQVG
jgi:D-glycero-alpha-D-manno-heptose-7-phosphate kinase